MTYTNYYLIIKEILIMGKMKDLMAQNIETLAKIYIKRDLTQKDLDNHFQGMNIKDFYNQYGKILIDIAMSFKILEN